MPYAQPRCRRRFPNWLKTQALTSARLITAVAFLAPQHSHCWTVIHFCLCNLRETNFKESLGMTQGLKPLKPRCLPPLDEDFLPAVLANRAFQQFADNDGVP